MSATTENTAHLQQVTPPSSFIRDPLTPPLTNEKRFPGALRVLALFRQIKAGRHADELTWASFQLVPGEYEEIERVLKLDEDLGGFVDDKIHYDYDEERHRVFVRMPTETHEHFLEQVKDAIWSQVKALRDGTGKAAQFAKNVRSGGSSRIKYSDSGKSKNEPDAIYVHREADYPGVIIEVAYTEKKKDLRRLAHKYILDSDANVQVVVGLDVEYGQKSSRKATLSIWRPQIFDTAEGPELRAVEEALDEAFRDANGNPTHHLGLRLRLSDFAHQDIVHNEMGNEDSEISISGAQLFEYLSEAEKRTQQYRPQGTKPLPPGVKKRQRSETPPEELASEDEAKFAEQEERAAKRAARDDNNYVDS